MARKNVLTAERKLQLLSSAPEEDCPPTYIVCPACAERRLGSDTKRTLQLRSEDGVIKYRCFRGSCDLWGSLSALRYSCVGSSKVRRQDTPPPIAFDLGEDNYKFLATRFGIDYEDVLHNNIRQTESGDVLYSIVAADRTTVGYVNRSYTGRLPKALTYYAGSQQAKLLHYATPVDAKYFRRKVPNN